MENIEQSVLQRKEQNYMYESRLTTSTRQENKKAANQFWQKNDRLQAQPNKSDITINTSYIAPNIDKFRTHPDGNFASPACLEQGLQTMKKGTPAQGLEVRNTDPTFHRLWS